MASNLGDLQAQAGGGSVFTRLAQQYGLATPPKNGAELIQALSGMMTPDQLELLKYLFQQPDEFVAQPNVFPAGQPQVPAINTGASGTPTNNYEPVPAPAAPWGAPGGAPASDNAGAAPYVPGAPGAAPPGATPPGTTAPVPRPPGLDDTRPGEYVGTDPTGLGRAMHEGMKRYHAAQGPIYAQRYRDMTPAGYAKMYAYDAAAQQGIATGALGHSGYGPREVEALRAKYAAAGHSIPQLPGYAPTPTADNPYGITYNGGANPGGGAYEYTPVAPPATPTPPPPLNKPDAVAEGQTVKHVWTDPVTGKKTNIY